MQIAQSWWQKIVNSFRGPSNEEAAASWKITNSHGEFVSIPSKDGLELERALDRALKYRVETSPPLDPEKVFPADVLEPANAKKEVPCGGAKEIEASFSQPIVVGDIAFIETAGFCGGLCGSGHLQAYRYAAGKWQFVASKLLWIA